MQIQIDVPDTLGGAFDEALSSLFDAVERMEDEGFYPVESYLAQQLLNAIKASQRSGHAWDFVIDHLHLDDLRHEVG